MKVKIKLLKNSIHHIPMYKEGDSGFDLSVEGFFESGEEKGTLYKTGIAVEVPKGYELQIRPRSSSYRKGYYVVFGTVDSSYRGELLIQLAPQSSQPSLGERIAQAVIAPVATPEIEFVNELSKTERGEKGFGSSGGYKDEQ